MPIDGLHLKRSGQRYYKVSLEKTVGDRIVQSWDTASKGGVFSDYSVCTTALIRKREIYVLDVYRAKLQFPDLTRHVEELAKKWRVNVVFIEDAASGQQLIQVLHKESQRGVPRQIARKPLGDIAARFAAQSHRIEAGDLILLEAAPWLRELQRDLVGFPILVHDDQVGALTQLLAWDSTRSQHTYVGDIGIPLLMPKLIEG